MKCLDTYALIEISKGNEKFSKYSEEDFVVPDIVIAEFYGVILREYNEKTADYWFKKFENNIKSTNIYTIIKAIKFKQEHNKENLSFFDCIGYIFAKENNIKFVTGDEKFENKQNVEYVKK